VRIQQIDCLFSGKHSKLHVATPGLLLYVRADRQVAIHPRPDHQQLTMPRDLLSGREMGMPELIAELLGRTFLTLSYVPAVNYDVVVVFDSIDFDRPESEVFNHHSDRMLRPTRAAVTLAD